MRIVILLVLSSSLSFAKEITLQDAFSAAVKTSEYDLRNRSIRGQAASRLDQAKSYLFPTVSAVGQYRDNRFTDDDTDEKTQSNQRSIGLNLRQSLFQGGLYSAVQREKASKEIADIHTRKNDLNLYQAVAQSYYRILLFESTMEVLKEIDQVTENRVGILRKRVGIGKSKQSDFLSNQLQSQALKIEMGQLLIDLLEEKENFSRLTGLPLNSQLSKLEALPNLKSEQYYIGKISQTPDLQLQAKSLHVAEKDESILKAQHLPKVYVDLAAKYGEINNNEEGKDYTATLTLELPLFEGGRTSAAAREASWRRNEEKAKYDTLQKDVLLQIKNQYNDLSKSLELFKIYEESLVTARKNYQFFNRELQLGLVSNLEILNSVTDYLDAKKNREEAFFQLKLVELNLSQLVGEIN
jgi:outer membrane protein